MKNKYVEKRVFIVLKMVHWGEVEAEIAETEVADIEGTEGKMMIQQGIKREDEMLIAMMIMMTKMLKEQL